MNGAEVLCHWNAFGYSQGDMFGLPRPRADVSGPLAVADRSERNVARRIDSY